MAPPLGVNNAFMKWLFDDDADPNVFAPSNDAAFDQAAPASPDARAPGQEGGGQAGDVRSAQGEDLMDYCEMHVVLWINEQRRGIMRDLEVKGVINSRNRTFTLPIIDYCEKLLWGNVEQVLWFRNGLLQSEGADYEREGSAFTFGIAPRAYADGGCELLRALA